MTARSFNQMWFADCVARNGLSIKEWGASEVVVTTANVIHRKGNVTWKTVGEELIRVPLWLIEADIEMAKAYVDESARARLPVRSEL
jgi:hypothetical protein